MHFYHHPRRTAGLAASGLLAALAVALAPTSAHAATVGIANEVSRELTGVQPGSSIDASVAIVPKGAAVDRFYVTMSVGGPGILSFAEEFANCLYGTDRGLGGRSNVPTMLCTVEQRLEADSAYAPDTPLKLTVGDDVMNASASSRAFTDKDVYNKLKSMGDYRAGSGAKKLGYAKRQSAPETLDPDFYTSVRVSTTLTADMAIADATVTTTPKGTSVKVVTTNLGPGKQYSPINSLLQARVDLPPGVKYDSLAEMDCKWPKGTIPGVGTADGTWLVCWLVEDSAQRGRYTTTIDVPGAVPGGSAVKMTLFPRAFDKNPANDAVTIDLVPGAKPKPVPPMGGTGSSGGAASSGATSGGATGNTTGGNAASTGGAAAGNQPGNGGPELAETGGSSSSTPVIAGVAGGLLVVAGGAFVVARRRKAAAAV
ncbi:LAETG motif-containing sortase-dependent surface protein [Yinghuangia aomiensis]